METQPEAEHTDRFDKSLQELKALRSQLHLAADFCESAFMHAEAKTVVVDSTREYICRAVVSMVDHLGNVSENLDSLLSNNTLVSDAELRIDCLNQKLGLCQEYAQKLALARLQRSMHGPRHCPRYVLPCKQCIPMHAIAAERLNGSTSRKYENSTAAKATKEKEIQPVGENPVLFSTKYSQKPPLPRNPTSRLVSTVKPTSTSASPNHGGQSKPRARNNPPFYFQHTHKVGRDTLHRKSVSLLSFVRWSKHSSIE